MRVLLTGGGGAGNEALWRLLGPRYELHFADADGDAFDPLIANDRRHIVPRAAEAGFVEAVNSLCRDFDIDLLVPGVDEELLPLARAEKRIAPTRLLLPHADYVAIMLDKLESMRRLSQRGIPVPRTESLDAISGEIPFPCIAKPRHGRGSRGVRFVENADAALALQRFLGPQAAHYVLQEKMAGREFTVLMAASTDCVLAAVVPVEVDLKRGITLRARTAANPDVIAACTAIHNVMPAAGCYNIQLILSDNGVVRPFEINPRISTTCCLSVAAGIDPIEIFLARKMDPRLLPFQAGVELRRHWKNHILTGSHR
jgi:carbamoyl-phosphate synthase large subunit